MTTPKQTVLVVGGTGAQGSVLVRTLSSTNAYDILVLTRSISAPHSQEIASLPHVSLIEDPTPVGFSIDTFVSAARRSDAVFVNTNGFAIGDILETYWGIRLFELSVYAGVKHFIYSGLDNVYRDSGYDPAMYVAHYQGKNRVQDWIHSQPPSTLPNPMKWTILRSGPYIESLSDSLAPILPPPSNPNAPVIFPLPLSPSGAIPFLSLSDFSQIVHYTLSHPHLTHTLDLGVSIAHITLSDIAKAYTAVTGRPSIAKQISTDEWNDNAWANLPKKGEEKIGWQNVKDGNALSLSYKENFGHWWNLYGACRGGEDGEQGLIKRDYEMLDEILPGRIRGVEEWMRKTQYTGERRGVLKTDLRERGE